jgi:hypothetical protein
LNKPGICLSSEFLEKKIESKKEKALTNVIEIFYVVVKDLWPQYHEVPWSVRRIVKGDY